MHEKCLKNMLNLIMKKDSGIYLDWTIFPPTEEALNREYRILSAMKPGFLFLRISEWFPWDLSSEIRGNFVLNEKLLNAYIQKIAQINISVIPVFPGPEDMSFLLSVPGFSHFSLPGKTKLLLKADSVGCNKFLEDLWDDGAGIFEGLDFAALDLSGMEDYWAELPQEENAAEISNSLKSYIEHFCLYLNEQNITPILFVTEKAWFLLKERIQEKIEELTAVFIDPSGGTESLKIVSVKNSRDLEGRGNYHKKIKQMPSLFKEFRAPVPLSVFPFDTYAEIADKAEKFEKILESSWKNIRFLRGFCSRASADIRYKRSCARKAVFLNNDISRSYENLRDCAEAIKENLAGIVPPDILDVFFSAPILPVLDEYRSINTRLIELRIVPEETKR